MILINRDPKTVIILGLTVFLCQNENIKKNKVQIVYSDTALGSLPFASFQGLLHVKDSLHLVQEPLINSCQFVDFI